MKSSLNLWEKKKIRHQNKLALKKHLKDKKLNKKNGRRWNHPDIPQKYLKISRAQNFGRCIRASQSIDVGKTVMIAVPFATVVKNSKNVPYCLTCHAVDVDLISCRNCSLVWFCNSRCQNSNATHPIECGTQFHDESFIVNIDEKCAIQIVFEAMTAFEDFKDLRNFIKMSFKERDGIPEGSNTKASRLDAIIKLQNAQYRSDEEIQNDNQTALEAYEKMCTFPRVREFFRLGANKKGEQVLKRLLIHSIPALAENSFNISLLTKKHGELDRILLYDILSYLNHSCSPNLINVIEGNVMRCITSHRIQRGEQMFISYYPFEKETRKRRQRELRNWNFECKCVLCKSERNISSMEFKRANKLNLKDIKRKLNRLYDWTPQKGAYIIRYRHLISV